jgi:hypothetical protein
MNTIGTSLFHELRRQGLRVACRKQSFPTPDHLLRHMRNMNPDGFQHFYYRCKNCGRYITPAILEATQNLRGELS